MSLYDTLKTQKVLYLLVRISMDELLKLSNEMSLFLKINFMKRMMLIRVIIYMR